MLAIIKFLLMLYKILTLLDSHLDRVSCIMLAHPS